LYKFATPAKIAIAINS